MYSALKYNALSILLIISIFSFDTLNAQNSDEEEKRNNQEFRAAWVASVLNLDWPIDKFATSENQKLQMLAIFDSLVESGFNAVFLQVRAEADALYESEHAPWSYFLTGEEGTPPDPYYDPLEFAIEEAHKRGLELHAWINPYRAVQGHSSAKEVSLQDIDPALYSVTEGRYFNDTQEKSLPPHDRDSTHVYYSNPEWLLNVAGYVFMDPGLPEVIQHVKEVVGEIVNNYDVDGIHMDDYFYPYPQNEMAPRNPDFDAKDDSTFAAHPRGFDNKYDWRRNNVNLLIKELQDTVKSVKPYVKFGVSPFGIWQSGTPSGITGMNPRTSIYADALMWIEDESIDYLIPQLYWRFGGQQDFAKLSEWWLDQVTDDIHFYAGLGVYKSDSRFSSDGRYSANEVPKQVRHTREIGADGNVMFRSRNLTVFNSGGIRDTLRTDLYKHRALTPSFNQIDLPIPGAPSNMILAQNPILGESSEILLSWDRPAYEAGKDSLVRYAIYRVEGETAPSADEILANPENLVAITGQEEFTDSPGNTETSYHYAITAFNRNSQESEPSEVVSSGVVTSAEEDYEPIVKSLRLDQNYPNPFNPSTNISFQLPENSAVSLKVYDMVGREVAVLIDGQKSAGSHTVTFDASALPSGVYFYRLATEQGSLSRKMTLIK